jgi:outer membrane protein assembly factor BamB
MASRRPRVRALAAVALLAAAVLAGAAVTAPPSATDAPPADDTPTPRAEGPYPGHTLLGIQAEGWFGNNNGRALIVSPAGETVWEYDPPNARVFDVELLENGNVLASVAVVTPETDCPDEFDDDGTCVHNRVVELDYDSKDVVWEYDWYDAFPNHHEVHDADRLPSGETAIVDMGNDRAIVVSEDGRITWEWSAVEHLSEGTRFWNEYVPEASAGDYRRRETDWTHMNDVDLLANGNFLLSIRNFDVAVEVRRSDGRIVAVHGSPGEHATMREQHNPNMLERHGTLLVADSENDRVIEFNTSTGETVWRYDGTGSGQRLAWPRDADRLPGGHTLVTDSRNFRVLEVDEDGEVVWSYAMPDRRGIIYEADRIRLPSESAYLAEEPEAVPPGNDLDAAVSPEGGVDGTLATLDSWLGFVFPQWVGPLELLVGLVGLASLVGLGWELRRDREPASDDGPDRL